MTTDPTRDLTSSGGSIDAPEVVRTRAEAWEARWRLPGRVALVPTMGALHEGHAALIRAARGVADAVVVSIFVNPLQFGPGEDLDRYPRSLDADLRLCRAAGAHLVFAPAVEEMYARGSQVRIAAGPLGERLEGSSRPGHFDGVLTVVAKLLHLVQPHVAVLGEKDAQQLAIVRRMVADLDFPLRVVGVPVVREPDGLAVSSRNRYLTADQRPAAAALSRALGAGRAAARQGVVAVLEAASAVLGDEPGVRLDYLRLVNADFDDVPVAYRGAARLLVAAYVGTTRLIDNVEVDVGLDGPEPDVEEG
ncbi:MAG: pantoate--beta-alanine ligase [Frankiaceae bacterium]